MLTANKKSIPCFFPSTSQVCRRVPWLAAQGHPAGWPAFPAGQCGAQTTTWYAGQRPVLALRSQMTSLVIDWSRMEASKASCTLALPPPRRQPCSLDVQLTRGAAAISLPDSAVSISIFAPGHLRDFSHPLLPLPVLGVLVQVPPAEGHTPVCAPTQGRVLPVPSEGDHILMFRPRRTYYVPVQVMKGLLRAGAPVPEPSSQSPAPDGAWVPGPLSSVCPPCFLPGDLLPPCSRHFSSFQVCFFWIQKLFPSLPSKTTLLPSPIFTNTFLADKGLPYPFTH